MKVEDIKEIIIESEVYGRISGSKGVFDDNSDITVILKNGDIYDSLFITYENLQNLRKKNIQTGECCNGLYFFASNMLLIEDLSRETVEKVIFNLIKENEFTYALKKRIN